MSARTAATAGRTADRWIYFSADGRTDTVRPSSAVSALRNQSSLLHALYYHIAMELGRSTDGSGWAVPVTAEKISSLGGLN